MDSLWVDTQGEGYPDINDDKFVPTFIKENKKSLDSLAKMMLSYKYEFHIDFYEEEVRVIISEENLKQEEVEILRMEDNGDGSICLALLIRL